MNDGQKQTFTLHHTPYHETYFQIVMEKIGEAAPQVYTRV